MAEYDGSIRIGVKVDADSAERDLKTLTESVETSLDGSLKTTDKFKSALATAGKVGVAAAGAAATAVGVLAKQSLDAYASFEQLTGGVETLFKDSAGTIMQYADNAYKTAGLSANQYMETVTGFSASLLQSLGGDTAKAADVADMAITDMADNANKMGTAMESIQNAYQGFAKQNYTMLDNLKLGYGGTMEEMERLLADAERLSGVHYDISSFSDVANAIHVVQTELGITGTTAEEAASTIEGSANSMKAAWENLLTGLANEDADLSTLARNFVESVKTNMENMMPKIEQIVKSIAAVIAELAPILGEEIPKLLAQILPKLLEAGVGLIVGVAKGMVNALPKLLEAALTGAVDVGKNIVKGIWDGMCAMIEWLVEKVKGFVDTIIDTAKSALGIASPSKVFAGIGEYTVEGFAKGVKSGAGLASNALDSIQPRFDVNRIAASAQPQLYNYQAGIALKSAAVSGPSFEDMMRAVNMAGQNTDSGTMDVNVNFTGSLAQFVRMLQPKIEIEQRRLGTNLVEA